jgi:hypothetical protein
MVSKQIQPYWYLQQLVDAEVRRLAPDAAVTPVVMYDDEKIRRHEDCPGVGRVRTAGPYIGVKPGPTISRAYPWNEPIEGPATARRPFSPSPSLHQVVFSVQFMPSPSLGWVELPPPNEYISSGVSMSRRANN